jgi:ATP-binding protein involved in chromosome partitioning
MKLLQKGVMINIADKKENNYNIEEKLKNVKNKIVVLSGKGGVGKSTISANLAQFLSEKGKKVGILDSDIHGPSIPKILGVEEKKICANQKGIIPVQTENGLKIMSMAYLIPDKDAPVIWRGPMKMGALRQLLGGVLWEDLDYLIIDMPPGTGDEPLSIAQLIPDIRGVIVVTTPQDVALVSVRKSINFVKKMNLKIIGIVENMSGFTCPHCSKKVDIFKTGGGKKAAEDFKIPYLGSIPLNPEIVEIGDSKKKTNIKDKNTINSYKKFVENVEKIVGGEK